jgi:hypothetical protein
VSPTACDGFVRSWSSGPLAIAGAKANRMGFRLNRRARITDFTESQLIAAAREDHEYCHLNLQDSAASSCLRRAWPFKANTPVISVAPMIETIFLFVN